MDRRSLVRSIVQFVCTFALVMITFCQTQAFAQSQLQSESQSQSKTASPAEVPQAIFDYVNKPDAAYAWKLVDKRESQAGRVFQLELTSQTWHDITWKHQLVICEPKLVRHPNHGILFVNGGSNKNIKRTPRDIGSFMTMATLSGGIVASIYQVPNQPLFDDRYEDDLISETWLKYLQTGDTSWPLLFPMVKSASRAMDAVQEFCREELQKELRGFVITGASKRGWTSWLTPVVDKRIVATAPVVIDTLNFRRQIRHQHDVWGEFSEQIADYTRKGLVKLDKENERERSLREMMDPWTYRSKLSLPKLIVNGTNDPYWCVDAIGNYWSDLSGPKYTLQIPNTGHGLKGGRDTAVATLAALFDHVVSQKDMPKLAWSFDDSKNTLTISSSPPARAARLWLARSDDGDFRDNRFEPRDIPLDAEGRATVQLNLSDDINEAFFAEFQFGVRPAAWSLSSIVWRR